MLALPQIERNRRDQQVCQLYRDGKKFREIAEVLEIPMHIIGSIVHKFHLANRRTQLRPKRLEQPTRCERHGKLIVWPCVACAAEASIADGKTNLNEIN